MSLNDPKNKLEYLLVYFDLLTKTKQEDRFMKWNGEEVEKVAKQIQEEISKLEY